MALPSKYAPKDFSEVLGQPMVIRRLRAFVRNPYPCALLFQGNSGIGKSVTAKLLASALGCRPEWGELGGVFHIPSGEQSAETVRECLLNLCYRPFYSERCWRVLIVEEADRISKSAEAVWLSALEDLPNQSVVIFTTNYPDDISDRLRDRCLAFGFESSAAKLRPWLKVLASRVWTQEGMTGEPAGLDFIGMGEDDTVSFRLALQQLAAGIQACSRLPT
jgi:DNA polymerase III subunit gamma/tau